MASIARRPFLVVGCAWGLTLAAAAVPAAQGPAVPQPQAPATTTPPAKPETGIPVTDQTVQKACGTCHRPDDKQQLTRISFRRTTPEGWERTITRMMALNGLKIDAPTARAVVKSLSNSHGLAPEEARLVNYEMERRLVDEKVNKDLDGTCNACHSEGRVLAQRRTRQDWELLIAMHRGYYPIIDRQTYRRMGPPPRGRDESGRPPDLRHPSEKVVDYLAEAQPLETKAWAAWSASVRPARIDGTWALSGWEPGKGPVFGRVVLAPAGGADRRVHQPDHLYLRAYRPAGDAGRAGHHLHRLPVARTLHRRRRRRFGAARGDVRRARLDEDSRAAGSPAATTSSAST